MIACRKKALLSDLQQSGSLPPWLAKIAGKNVASVEEGEWPYTGAFSRLFWVSS